LSAATLRPRLTERRCPCGKVAQISRRERISNGLMPPVLPGTPMSRSIAGALSGIGQKRAILEAAAAVSTGVRAACSQHSIRGFVNEFCFSSADRYHREGAR
jgi:hypothetical protein